MSGWIDRATLGPGRRRRRVERQFRALDRKYARTPQGAGNGGPRRDVRSGLSLVITLVVVAALAVVEPSLVPASFRRAMGLGPERLAHAPAATGTGSYAFLTHQPGAPDMPVAYDPCRPIGVRINPAGGPPGAVALVRDALAEVGRATGLDFRYDGPTTERPKWENPTLPTILGHVRTRPVLVAWATAAEVPQLAGDVAGVGGSVPVSAPDGVVRYATGGATLDADAFASIAALPNGGPVMRAIVLHELGHVVGLGHVDDPGELMYPDNLGLLDFGSGDRRGLAKVGSGSCA